MEQNIRDLLCNVVEYLQNLSDNDRFFALKNHLHIKSEITDFTHGNESHTDTYSTKSYVDSQLSTKRNTNDKIPISDITNLQSNLNSKATTLDLNSTKDSLQNSINNKSKVTFNRTLSSGTKVGTISIDGANTDLYCEHNTDTTYGLASGSNNGLMSKDDKNKIDHISPYKTLITDTYGTINVGGHLTISPSTNIYVFVQQNGIAAGNKKVEIFVNNICYERTTDSMGFATMTINLPSDNYTIIALHRDGNFVASIDVKMVTVR